VPPQQAREGVFFTLDLARYFGDDNDGDAASITFALSGLATGSGLTFDRLTGVLSGVPLQADVSSFLSPVAVVTVTAADPRGATVSTTFTLSVENVNDAPLVVAAADDVVGVEQVPSR
jgi:hypothetical protein